MKRHSLSELLDGVACKPEASFRVYRLACSKVARLEDDFELVRESALESVDLADLSVREDGYPLPYNFLYVCK